MREIDYHLAKNKAAISIALDAIDEIHIGDEYGVNEDKFNLILDSLSEFWDELSEKIKFDDE